MALLIVQSRCSNVLGQEEECCCTSLALEEESEETAYHSLNLVHSQSKN